MTDRFAIRGILRAAAGPVVLPLLLAGCQQHSHVATTQIVVNVSSTQTATAVVVAPESGTSSRAQSSPSVGQQFANGTRDAGHHVAQGSRAVGHDVAEASRDTYHAAANGVRSVGNGVADLTTNSVVGIRNTPAESLSAPIIDVDAAMQVRDWDQVTAEYKSGRTIAGPIGFLYEPKGDQSQWRYGVIEVPLFFVNTALLPYAFCKTPPWKPVEWKAATVAPTYTAVPPLPPLP